MCRDAVLVRIHRGHELLGAATAEPVRARLFSAVAKHISAFVVSSTHV
jgi:hypothetical protein